MTPQVIYLHGFASGPGSQKAQFFHRKFFESGVEIHLPDLAGGDFERITISRQLAVVERVAQGGPVRLIGSSLGGYLSALYAARHPEVDRLVLLAPAFCFPTRWVGSLGPERVEEWKRTGKLPVYHYAERRERDLGYQMVEDGAQYEDYPDFHQPALILHGHQDPVVPSSLSERFVATHPNSRLCLLNSGHELTDALETLWRETATFFGVTAPEQQR